MTEAEARDLLRYCDGLGGLEASRRCRRHQAGAASALRQTDLIAALFPVVSVVEWTAAVAGTSIAGLNPERAAMRLAVGTVMVLSLTLVSVVIGTASLPVGVQRLLLSLALVGGTLAVMRYCGTV